MEDHTYLTTYGPVKTWMTGTVEETNASGAFIKKANWKASTSSIPLPTLESAGMKVPNMVDIKRVPDYQNLHVNSQHQPHTGKGTQEVGSMCHDT